MKTKKILGIDIGGSGIKGAVVDTKTGEMITDRHRIPTPEPATPGSVADVIDQIVKYFKWKGPVGIGYPGVVQNGIVKTAANVDASWLDMNIENLIARITGCPTSVVNDADAAGMAEMKFGAGKGHKGVVFLATVGTGIGTVMFTNGKLIQNLELGHIILKGEDAEKYASDSARQKYDLTWEQWAGRFSEYLEYIEDLFWPDLIIIGGGTSKKSEIISGLKTRAKIVPAQLLNNAGIIGAALAAKSRMKNKKKQN